MNKYTADTIIATGSIDGILTTAALAHHVRGEPEIVFCQPHRLPEVAFHDRRVALVDLAVNVRDPDMTASWLRDLAASNKIVAVIDEHDREAWHRAFEAAGLRGVWDGLEIQPVSQADGEFLSSGALLMDRLSPISDHERALCLAADAADRMDLTNELAHRANSIIKSDIRSQANRVRLARELAASLEPSAWQRELSSRYEEIARRARDVVARARAEHGVSWADAQDYSEIDVTACFGGLYESADFGVIFTRCGEDRLTIGTSRTDVDLLAAASAVGVPATGFAQKVTLAGDDYGDLYTQARRIIASVSPEYRQAVITSALRGAIEFGDSHGHRTEGLVWALEEYGDE